MVVWTRQWIQLDQRCITLRRRCKSVFLICEDIRKFLVFVAVHKGGEIFPDAMMYGIFIETILIHVVDQTCLGAVPPHSYVLVQFADVAEYSGTLNVYLVKAIDLVCNLFGYLTISS